MVYELYINTIPRGNCIKQKVKWVYALAYLDQLWHLSNKSCDPYGLILQNLSMFVHKNKYL